MLTMQQFRTDTKKLFEELLNFIKEEVYSCNNDTFNILCSMLCEQCNECLKKNIIPTLSHITHMEDMIKHHDINAIRNEVMGFKNLLRNKY